MASTAQYGFFSRVHHPFACPGLAAMGVQDQFWLPSSTGPGDGQLWGRPRGQECISAGLGDSRNA